MTSPDLLTDRVVALPGLSARQRAPGRHPACGPERARRARVIVAPEWTWVIEGSGRSGRVAPGVPRTG